MFRKVSKILTGVFLFQSLLSPAYAAGGNDTVGLTRVGHTNQELDRYWKSYQTRALDTEDFYGIDLINPVSDEVYIQRECEQGTSSGELSNVALEDSLHLVNTMRYMAGLDEVSLDKGKNNLAQAAAYVSSLNDYLDHFPACPDILDQAIYNAGYEGCSKSNLSMDYGALLYQTISYMRDEDPTNSDSLGHRRWILDVNSKTIGIGANDWAGAMHVIDSNVEYWNKEVVAWPSRACYSEMIGEGTPWSLLVGNDFGKLDNKIKVEVTDLDTEEILEYSVGHGLVINDEYFGRNQAIIFGSDLSTSPGKHYQVSVSGLRSNSGSYPVKYKVNFISAYENNVDLVEAEPIQVSFPKPENKAVKKTSEKKIVQDVDWISQVKKALKKSRAKLMGLEYIKEHMPRAASKYKDVLDRAIRESERSIAEAESWLKRNEK